MSQDNKDLASLWDMSQAIAEIQEDTTGLSYEDFKQSRLVRRAVERNFMILGEAARRISEAFRNDHPEVDWRGIVGLRNVLAHEYEKVRHEILWDVIKNLLPNLAQLLQKFLEES